jgi:antitoxin component YwqK of YwqJK toxin-antitoxin module
MEKITNLVTLDFAWQLVTAFLQCLKINLIMNRLIILFSSLAFIALTSCESGQEELPDEAMQGIALQDMLGEEEYWEGNKLEYKELFFINQTDLFCKTDSNKTYSGIIKVRSRKGTIALLESYSSGLKNGDFFEYHDTGKLKSKRQYKQGMRHGYFFEWLNDGTIYSRKYFQDDLEDFGRFDDEGVSTTGKSMAALELATWKGEASDFYFKFAGDPKRGGIIHIRETEELYDGNVTALDNEGRKEAMLRYRKGKYHGTISKWDEKGNLWEEAEYDRGILVAFTIKNGKPFDPTQVIDVSEDPEMVNILFGD